MTKQKIMIISSAIVLGITGISKEAGDATLIAANRRTKGLHEFLHSVGYFESENKYTAVNEIGMLGRYQFHPRTIKELGYTVTPKQFLQNTKLQDSVMVQYMRDNRRELKPLIKKYAGRVVRGVHVTESGILAAAHLAGTGGVWSWFYPNKYHYGTVDKNGASVKLYMKKFGGYNMREL